jgi:hypothetical protein
MKAKGSSAALALLLGVPSGRAAASEAPRPETHGPTVAVGSDHRLQALPATDFYPRYLADPRQPTMKAFALSVLETDTPETDSPLLEFTLGGRIKLLRLHPTRHPERGLQLSVEGGFISRFDPRANLDQIGWDGYYAFNLAYRPFEGLAIKLAEQHDSAHISDEYIAKTGRKRITYTREELALGVMVRAVPPLRVYSELGYAVRLGNPELRRFRAQGGLELDLGFPYFAADATFWQELGWWPTITAQLGLKVELPALSRRYGVAAQYENGRSLLGEFYRDRNRTLGVGVWIDL